MPFTVNVGPYEGGNFLAGGLANLGKGFAEGLDKWQEAQKNEAADNLIIDYALKTGAITPEQHTAFLNGGRSQKDGIVAGLVRQFALETQRQQLEATKEQRQAQAELRQQQAAAFSWQPSDADRASARAAGGELVPTGPGKYSFAPYGDSTNPNDPNQRPQILPFNDPISGKAVPGMAVVRQPGGKQFQVVPFGGDEPVVQVDESGTPYIRGPKGTKLPLTLQQAMAFKMQGIELPGMKAKTDSGENTAETPMGKVWNWIKNLNTSATDNARQYYGAPAPGAMATPAAASSSAAPAPTGKQLDQATAAQFLQQAGGDKDKARDLARAAGYTF